MKRILMVDDESNFRYVVAKELRRSGYFVVDVDSGEAALNSLADHEFDAVLLDVKLPDQNGLEILGKMKSGGINAEIIMITGHGTVDNAVRAMKQGAFDYILKPFKRDELANVIERAIEKKHLSNDNRRLRQLLGDSVADLKLVGRSETAESLRSLITRHASSDSSVLLLGPDGAGKHHIARLIHAASLRRDHTFYTLDCRAISHDRLPEMLFGFVERASGRYREEKGVLSLLEGGSLYFKEFAALNPDNQRAMLPFVESGAFNPIGSLQKQSAAVRLMFATSEDIKTLVRKDRIIPEFLHRINVLNITVPPLAAHREDIPDLLEHFCSCKHTTVPKMSDKSMRRLVQYTWNGNIRELRHVTERLLLSCDEGHVSDEDVALVLGASASSAAVDGPTVFNPIPLPELEQRHILRMLEYCGGNKKKTAEALGITERTLYNKLATYGM